jgi:serine/threonine protein phosphatase 1
MLARILGPNHLQFGGVMNSIYAIGDVRGHLDKLDQALDCIERDGGKDAPIVFVGDLVDRGPDSRGVIQRVIDAQAQGRDWTVVKGNHDRMFEWFLQSPPQHDPHLMVGMSWLHERLGGLETLASYGVDVTPMQTRLSQAHSDALAAVPATHQRFLRDLPLFHVLGNVLFVHAGIRYDRDLHAQTENDLLWLRQDLKIAPDRIAWRYLVHGHTPIAQPKQTGQIINIDGGAAFGRVLSPIVIEDDGVFVLSERGREAICGE